MNDIGKKFRKLVLVCTNVREDGRECCSQKGSVELHKKLKEAMSARGGSANGGKAVDLTIRVSKSGCLDRCSEGATVTIQPDDIWLGGVTEADIPHIVALAVGKEKWETVIDFEEIKKGGIEINDVLKGLKEVE